MQYQRGHTLQKKRKISAYNLFQMKWWKNKNGIYIFKYEIISIVILKIYCTLIYDYIFYYYIKITIYLQPMFKKFVLMSGKN